MEPKSGLVCRLCGWGEKSQQGFSSHLKAGTPIGSGAFVLGRVLGAGGFGITYLGWDWALKRKSAIKEYFPVALAARGPDRRSVSPSSPGNRVAFENGLRKFLQEGQALAALQDNPGIVSVLTFLNENGTSYLVMNYEEGVTFQQYLESHGRIDYEQGLAVAMPVMDALRAVHAAGILHRDISPDNIFISHTGRVKLLDFGAAKRDMASHIKSFQITLKCGYSPMEQYSVNGKQGPWTDVYALGATLYRALTGTVPPDALDRLDNDTLGPASRLGVKIPAAAERALLKALAVRPADRYQAIAEFQRAVSQPRQFNGSDAAGEHPDSHGRKAYSSAQIEQKGLSTESHMTNNQPQQVGPLALLTVAIRAVPAVKFALGVAGIAAALALSTSFFGSMSAALVGSFAMVGLMTLLVIFAGGIGRPDSLKLPSLILTWIVIVITSLSSFLVFSCIFFGWPKTFPGLVTSLNLNGKDLLAKAQTTSRTEQEDADAPSAPKASQRNTVEGIGGPAVRSSRVKRPAVLPLAPDVTPTAVPDVTFNLKLLSPHGGSTIVPSTHAFHDGDRFQFQFSLKEESYVYILNRTALGEPDSAPKGVTVADDSQVKFTEFKLLFPTDKTGTQNKIPARSVQAVPAGADHPFSMDNEPGEEQLFLVVSAKPLMIDKFFEPHSGTLRPEWRDESNLVENLRSMESNAEVVLSKGIEVDGAGIRRVQQKPILVSVNLKHYPKPR